MVAGCSEEPRQESGADEQGERLGSGLGGVRQHNPRTVTAVCLCQLRTDERSAQYVIPAGCGDALNREATAGKWDMASHKTSTAAPSPSLPSPHYPLPSPLAPRPSPLAPRPSPPDARLLNDRRWPVRPLPSPVLPRLIPRRHAPLVHRPLHSCLLRWFLLRCHNRSPALAAGPPRKRVRHKREHQLACAQHSRGHRGHHSHCGQLHHCPHRVILGQDVSSLYHIVREADLIFFPLQDLLRPLQHWEPQLPPRARHRVRRPLGRVLSLHFKHVQAPQIPTLVPELHVRCSERQPLPVRRQLCGQHRSVFHRLDSSLTMLAHMASRPCPINLHKTSIL